MQRVLHQQHHIHRGQSHLKWNRDEPFKIAANSGNVVTFDCVDGGNGMIKPDSTTDAVVHSDTSLADPMFGPVSVRGAEPGDALECRSPSAHDS